MSNPNIWNEAKKAWTTFKKWKSGNLNWRPRKWISAVNSELKEAWYEPATKADIEANYMSLLQLEESKLKEYLNNADKPMLIRIIAKNMLWGKGFEIIEKMLDRWVWKPIQSIQQTGEIDININMKDATDDELDKIIFNS